MSFELILAIVLLLIVFLLYNSLIGKKNQVQNAYGSIDALLKKRYDLIPNLVAVVKQYMAHEAGILEQVTELRAKAIASEHSQDDAIKLNNRISQSLGGILVAVEGYPDLKANDNFLRLQAALNEIEEQISAARRAYNASVVDYNNAVEMLPSSLLARLLRYRRKHLFEAGATARENVAIDGLSPARPEFTPSRSDDQ